MAVNNSEARVRETQQQLAVSNREKIIADRIRFTLGVGVLAVVALADILMAPKSEIWRVDNSDFSTAELVEQVGWIQGAAPILAKNFDSVMVTNVNNGAELAFNFDSSLAAIYQVAADYTFTPLDLRSGVGDNSGAQGKALASFLEGRGLVRHDSEVRCPRQADRKCRLRLIWREDVALRPLPVVLTAVVLEDKLFALIDRELIDELPTLGSAIESAENALRGGS
jgi:hypothetical protein